MKAIAINGSPRKVCLSIKKFSVWSRKVVHLPTQFCSLADGRPISFLTEYHLLMNKIVLASAQLFETKR
ncbi:hypothetical protein [uncultured Acetobacterium sp.]|uniref:hypothetical protein n=1 Tax=uncultured Acetobacterium sp. TaxID=217139 RepID=UPI0025ED1243|nr:hypothetical protein [uncultured Acetobacterium sp.]